jgi:hypothetical protein
LEFDLEDNVCSIYVALNSIAGYKNISLLHLHVKGANGMQGEKECSTTFVLEVIWDPVKAFSDE